MTFYTQEEVCKHNTKESCWLIANNNVYDATAFINRHPGGKFVILSIKVFWLILKCSLY